MRKLSICCVTGEVGETGPFESQSTGLSEISGFRVDVEVARCRSGHVRINVVVRDTTWGVESDAERVGEARCLFEKDFYVVRLPPVSVHLKSSIQKISPSPSPSFLVL